MKNAIDTSHAPVIAAFFGRRRGKSLSAWQSALFANFFQNLQLSLDQPPPQHLSDLFNHPVELFHLEIGFGGGEHLLHEATTLSNIGFIGAEPFVNGMAKILSKLQAKADPLHNIRLYHDDATKLLRWLPKHSLDSIDLLYPDPWPKKKHWKRRFINQQSLDLLAYVLKKGGTFRFASDVETYVNWTLQHIQHHPEFMWTAQTASDWQTPYERWSGTRYEAKAIKEGRTSAWLSFMRI